MERVRSQGFTLVELMIVVAIIGILAAIAIPNFLGFRLKAKVAEAKSNLGSIRIGEVSYYAEWNSYVGNQPPSPIANRAHHPERAAWIGVTRLSLVGFLPEGPVYFSYALGSAEDHPSGFTAHAYGDLDDDGGISDYYINDTEPLVKRTGAIF